MTTYVIGDVQGCFEHLQRLLDKIRFSPESDKLWFAGDLVNRGPDSLNTLRLVKDLGNSADSVLGNHDMHLLAVYYGTTRSGKKDTFRSTLNAADADQLIEWLRHRPMLLSYKDKFIVTHAGLHPFWDINTALKEADNLEQLIKSDKFIDFLQVMYGNQPDTWEPKRKGFDRARFALNCFTRQRFCDQGGRLDFKQKHSPGTQPKHLMPWFEHPRRLNKNLKLVFGHWSTVGSVTTKNVYPVDTGCVWGGSLTAFAIEDKAFIHYSC